MARIDALSLLQENGIDEALLAEAYGAVIEGFEAKAVSVALKNQNLSGDPSSGTVEAKRFVNSASQPYGTARTATAGDAILSEAVVIALDKHREIIEEVEAFDIKTFGVDGILARRRPNHIASMVREMDTAFFAEAYATGSKVTHTATAWDGKLEEMAVGLETVSNDYVDGVDRGMMAFVVTPSVHSALRLLIDVMPAQDNFYAKGAVGIYHGVPVFVSNHLPKAVGQVVDAFVMAFGSIAQPASADQFTPERIPLSKAIALELFYDYGTKAVTPDLIFYSGDALAS